MTSALHRIEITHRDNLKREGELKKRLETTEAECRAKLEQAEVQSKQIVAAAKTKADQIVGETLRNARRESERIIREAHERRDEIRKDLELEMDKKSVGLASDSIRFVFSTQIEQEIHDHLIADLLDEIDALNAQTVPPGCARAKVLTPKSLHASQHQRLEKILSGKAGRAIEIEQVVDEHLIAGISVQMDKLILDGSLQNKLREAVAYIRKKTGASS